MISGSYTQSQEPLDWLVHRANGVSVPHCPTATTRRSAAAVARPDQMRGAAMTAAAAVPVRLRNDSTIEFCWGSLDPPNPPNARGATRHLMKKPS